MFFSTINETILRETNESGPVWRFVYGSEKESMARNLNGDLNQDINKHNFYLRHASSKVNTVEEALSKCPMYCNFLMTKQYQNILFVGHFNSSQHSWLLPWNADRHVDLLPPEKEDFGQLVDPNIILQFVPLIFKMFSYKADMMLCKPPEKRNTGIMHSLYMKNGLTDNMIPTSCQYRHGMNKYDFYLSLEPNTAKFDAVVFLGVPKNEESFTVQQVKDCFSPICTPDFDLVDMYYNGGDDQIFISGESQDNTESLARVFSNRSEWDIAVQQSGGRPEELQLMDRIISVY